MSRFSVQRARASAHVRSHRKAYLWGAVPLAGLAAFAFATRSDAQAAGEIIFNLSRATRADGKIDVALTWSTAPRASGCVASGGWSGNRSPSRSSPLVLTALTPPVSYTLTCSWPGAADDDVTVRWLTPTQNVDGSPLTDLAGYRILFSTNPENLDQVVTIDNPAATSRVVEPLAPGTWHFAMVATNAAGTDSARTPTVQAVLSATTVDASKTVTAVAQIPEAPGGLTVEP